MRKIVSSLIAVTLLVITGCGGSGDTLSNIKMALQESFPNCSFELVTTSNQVERYGTKAFEEAYRTYPLTNPEFVTPANSEDDYDGATFDSGSSRSFEICNTEGVSIANMKRYTDVVNRSISDITGLPTNECWLRNSDNSVRLKACSDQLPLNDQVGVWFVIQKFENSEDAKLHALDVANRNFGYYSDYPIAYKDNYVFMFTGQIKEVSQNYVDSIDLSWSNLTTSVEAKLVSESIPNYSLVYDFKDAYESNYDHCSLRCMVGLGILAENP